MIPKVGGRCEWETLCDTESEINKQEFVLSVSSGHIPSSDAVRSIETTLSLYTCMYVCQEKTE